MTAEKTQNAAIHKANKDNISLKHFPSGQSEVLYQYLCFQKLCPGHFLIQAPWPYDLLDEEEIEDLKGKFTKLMPLDSMVMDLWDWGIHFEEITFDDIFFEVACGTESIVDQAAELLCDDFINWIDEYGMDYAQEQFQENDFSEWILENCLNFIRQWRVNIFNSLLDKTE